MSADFHTSNAPTAPKGSLQRVKDTCDSCSASKVKCDKKKPMCSRCQRLAYPCFYSPARRVRKHRPDGNAQLPSADEYQIPGSSPTAGFGDDTVVTESNLSDEFGLAWESNASYQLPSQDLCSSAFSNSDRSMYCPPLNDGHERKGGTKRLKATPTGSDAYGEQSPVPHVADSDCAGTAIDLLSQLNHDFTNTTTSSNDTSPTFSHELAIEKASLAIRQTSTILICPCSRKPDVGLLATAVCSAILDLYQTFLHPKATAAAGSGTTNQNTGHGLGMKRSNHSASSHNYQDRMITSKGGPMDLNPSKILQRQQRQQQHRSNSGSRSGGSDGGGGLQFKAPIMRILGELPRMADLLTQFRNRYYCSNNSSCQEDGVGLMADSSSRDLLRTLVAAMTSRLKLMIDEFTHLLVDT
ncbi:MAG: hypothetical protein Q9225_003563 [Loekoesia sp. 1 TL-2023]